MGTPPSPRPAGGQEGNLFDFAGWLERANAFTARWDDEPARVAAPPVCSDDDLAMAERTLGRPLPYSVEQFLRQCGSKNGFAVAVEHEGETILIGGTEWDITNLAGNIAWSRKIAGECEQYGLLEEAKFLNHALPLLAASNGDYIALDMRDSSGDPPVGYFAHADSSWPCLCPSLSAFLVEWERCCYAGPEWWTLEPFRDANGLLSGDTSAATALRHRLGGQPTSPTTLASRGTRAGGLEGIGELLKPLAAWFEAHPSGHPDALNFVFEPPSDRGAALVAGWTGKPDLHACLVPFGSTRNGSLYALWLVEHRTAKDAPVVLLDSEGVAYSYVVANRYPEFLAVLAAGLEDFDDPESVLPDSSELLAFREWVLTQGITNIPGFAEVSAITTEAFEAAPDFQSWLEALA